MKFLRLSAWIVLGWVIAGVLYIVFRYVGQVGHAVNPLDIRTTVDYGLFMRYAVVGGIVVGLLHTLLELLFDRSGFRWMSYGPLLVIKGGALTILVTVTFAVVTIWHYIELKGVFDLKDWLSLFLQGGILVPILYTSLIAFMISFTRQVSVKFGRGNLWKMLVGVFHSPREEERVFMFLDMKGSTAIAEKLGHLAFSRLIQDCFQDLTVVDAYQAEIYQYVGDEVILSWPVSRAVYNNQCVEMYFQYTEKILSQKAYYLQKYGLIPEFKAGINMGKVTVAEVGAQKREIAFHGDTLNTASRIEHLCSEVDKELLISAPLVSLLNPQGTFLFEPIGSIALRGKEHALEIYSVTRKAKINQP